MADGMRSVPVLITGCSSGIGRAAAVSLHAAGLTVYATARQVDELAGLVRQGIHTLPLDVTDEASMTAAVAAVEEAPWNDVAAGSLSAATPAGSGAGPGGGSPGDGGGPGGSAADGDPYAAYKAAVGASFGRTQAGLVGRFGSTPEDIAKVITQAVTVRRPRARYLINPVAKSLVALSQVLPARAYDSVMRRQYGLSR